MARSECSARKNRKIGTSLLKRKGSGNIQGQVGWGCEQADAVEDAARCRVLDMTFKGSFPPKFLCDSMIFLFDSTMNDQDFQILPRSKKMATVEMSLFLQAALSDLPENSEFKLWDTGIYW